MPGYCWPSSRSALSSGGRTSAADGSRIGRRGRLNAGRAGATMAPAMKLPSFRDVEGPVGKLLSEQGGIAAIVLDMVSLGRVERGFGEAAYHALHAHIEALMAELHGSVRDGDIITRDERHGDRYVVFL